MAHASVIGCGNMGSALIRGLASSGNHSVTACDVDSQALDRVADFCSQTTTDLEDATENDIVFVAVKPAIVGEVLDELQLTPDQTLVSIAAGVSTEFLEERTDANVVRLMPNLAAESQNMAAAVSGSEIDEELGQLLDDVGTFVEIDEAQMDIATAVNGSGPAFVFYLLDAMKQAGINGGLGARQAEKLAAQTFKGAAETVLQSDQSTDELIDAVCSPNGTTIEGMEVLWDSTADETIQEAVAAAARRSGELAEEFSNE